MKSMKSMSLGLAVVASLALSACGGGGGGAALPQQTAPQHSYTGPAPLAAFNWGKEYLNDAQYLGPANVGSMGINVQVAMRDEIGLYQYAKDVSNPASGAYRQFLRPDQIADRFGASQADYNKTAAYFAANHLHVGGWPQRQVLFVSGAQKDLETAFGTQFGLYRKAGNTFVAPIGTPHFQAAQPVSAVVGLVSAVTKHTHVLPIRAGDNRIFGYSPSQIQKAFDYTGAYSKGFDGTGITVGIIGTGQITNADVPAFGTMFHSRVATVNEVVANDSGVAAGLGASGIPTPGPTATPPYPPNVYPNAPGLASPPPVTMNSASCGGSPLASLFPTKTCNPEDTEAQLDTEQAASLAPGATVNFYFAFNPTYCVNNGCDSFVKGAIGVQGLAIADDEIQQVIADNKADVISLSYGGGETDNTGIAYDANGHGYNPVEFATLVSEGIAVFVSSGDAGAQECTDPHTGLPSTLPCVSYPSGDPSVVSVGGITLPLDQFGNLTNQITAWGDQTCGASTRCGSGGGISGIFAAPAWQSGITALTGKRGQPDVSLLADGATGASLVQNAGLTGGIQVGSVGGTSVAAPEMAAMWALVLQACKASSTCNKGGTTGYRLGNPNPLFYQLYNAWNTSSTMPADYAGVFTDVLYGNNSEGTPGKSGAPPTFFAGYNAGPGYDLTTGIGVPHAGHLITDITGIAVP